MKKIKFVSFQLTQSCPIDRVEFKRIFHRDHLSASESGHKLVNKHIEQDVIDDDDDDEEEVTLCQVCGRGDREHILLLCDSCDQGYHTTCLPTYLTT